MSEQTFIVACRPVERHPVLTIVPQEGCTESIAAKCGHKIWRRERLMIDDVQFSAPDKDKYDAGQGAALKRVFFPPKLCSSCEVPDMLTRTIRCILCANPIFPGSPVARYMVNAEMLKSEHVSSAAFTDDGIEAFGCLSMDCCPSGGFFAGHWDGNNVISPFAAGSAAGEAMATGKTIIL